MKLPIKIRMVLGFAFLMFLISCKNKTTKQEKGFLDYEKKIEKTGSIKELTYAKDAVKTIKIPQDIHEKSVDITKVVDSNSVRAVALETNEKSIIKSMDKLLFINDKIVVVDKGSDKIFLFAENGTFIKTIGEKGRGPGEYIELSDATIDTADNLVIIADGMGKKLLFYDLSGQLIKTKKAYYFINQFDLSEDGYFVISQSKNRNEHLKDVENYQIIIADTSQEILAKGFSYDQPQYDPNILIYNDEAFRYNNGKVFYNPRYTNLIYELNGKDAAILKYRLDLGEKDYLNNLEQYKTHEDVNYTYNKERLWHFSGVGIEAGNHFYTTIGNAGFVYYNILTKNLIYGNSQFHRQTKEEAGKEKKLGGPLLFPDLANVIAAFGKEFVSVYYPADHIGLKGENSSEAYRNLEESISAYDNPILIFFTLKNK